MNFLKSIVIAFCMIVGTTVLAESTAQQKMQLPDLALNNPAELTAYQMVQATTDRVMKIIIDAQSYYEKDPDRFYREVEVVLGDVVDFDNFARGVMGKYASTKVYKNLKTNEERALFRKRMKRFSEVFRDGLVQTYAMGLLAFDGNKIELVPPSKEEENNKTVTVVQRIYGEAEKPYIVHYKMRRNKSGVWRLRNVTIEAINLGKVYQSQFYSAVKQYNGDIDQVIDNWSVDPTKPQAKSS